MDSYTKKIILFICLFFEGQLYAKDDNGKCEKALSLFELSNLVESVRSEFFNHLAKHNIVLERFESQDVFFQTQPVMISLLGNVYFRKYKLQYNPRVLICPPSKKALTAILVHEFEHINDYFESSIKNLITFTGKYLLLKKFVAKYERATDLKACAKRQAEGLREYRVWLYKQLNAKQIKRKKENYLTPEELTQLIEE